MIICFSISVALMNDMDDSAAVTFSFVPLLALIFDMGALESIILSCVKTTKYKILLEVLKFK